MHWVWPSRPVSPKRMSFAVCYTSAVKPGPAALSQFNSLLTSKKSKKALLHFISLPAVEIPSFLVSSLLSSYWSIRVFLSFPGLSQGKLTVLCSSSPHSAASCFKCQILPLMGDLCFSTGWSAQSVQATVLDFSEGEGGKTCQLPKWSSKQLSNWKTPSLWNFRFRSMFFKQCDRRHKRKANLYVQKCYTLLIFFSKIQMQDDRVKSNIFIWTPGSL